jgi:hypothetical protein
LASDAVGLFLQIVPTLDELKVSFCCQNVRGASLRGSGSDYPATVHIGGLDFEVEKFDGPNLYGHPFSPISVSTMGGTAIFVGPDLVSIEALAVSGSPANPGLPSANPGQTITIHGSRFTTAKLRSPLIFQTIDYAGVRGELGVEPTSVVADGSQMTVVVPSNAVTGPVGVIGDPQGTSIILQIVPTVTSVVPLGAGLVRVNGQGLIEGGTLYRFGVSEVLDGSVSRSGVDVAGNNDEATVTLAALSNGALTVTTAGGTSAPIPFGAMLAADRTVYVGDASRGNLTSSALQSSVSEAIVRVEIAGLTRKQLDSLQAVTWHVRDLPGNYLGFSAGNTIFIDRDAAGWGWFIDSTPTDDSEFTTAGNQGEQDRLDLLTVVIHELGHLLGLDHDVEGAMVESLARGVRRADLEHDHDLLVDQAFGQWDDPLDAGSQ